MNSKNTLLAKKAISCEKNCRRQEHRPKTDKKMNNEKLVEYLTARGVLKTERIIKSMLAIDRKNFVIDRYKKTPSLIYNDAPLPIGYGQTISQPYTVAFMLELLQPERGDKILDVGAGSGWTTALLADITSKKGAVVGMEIIPELANFANANIARYNFANAKIINNGDLRSIQKSAYNKILVSAFAEKPPQALIDALKKKGRMIIPIKNSILKIDKNSDGSLIKNEYFGFSFVPLISKNK